MQPLRDLLEGPLAHQREEIESAQAALALVTQLCCEEGIKPTDGTEAPVPATEDALREREQNLQAREAAGRTRHSNRCP